MPDIPKQPTPSARNIAGDKSFFDKAIDGSKSFINGGATALGLPTPFDVDPDVPELPGDQTKASLGATPGSTSAQDEEMLRVYSDHQNTELSRTYQTRAQEFINTNKFAVRLENPQNGDVIAFRVSPESINESRQAVYKQLEPLHMPGAIQVYTHTTPRTWAVSGVKLISRNGLEAEDNLTTVNILRSWLTPYFGKSSTAGELDNYKGEMLGAPPPVLLFSAYSDGKLTSSQQNNSDFGGAHDGWAMGILRNVPVVIQSLNIPFGNDVDYIETDQTWQPFPVVLPLDFSLVETHSPKEFSDFDIVKYKQGILEGY